MKWIKLIKQSPLFVILLFSGILFTAAAAGGRKTIYLLFYPSCLPD